MKIAERRATLQGLNAPIRVDPVQLLAVAQVKPTTTEEHERLLEEILGRDKRRLRNGGEGYGDWRDDADREELAQRAGGLPQLGQSERQRLAEEK